jgi:hypothetical protein
MKDPIADMEDDEVLNVILNQKADNSFLNISPRFYPLENTMCGGCGTTIGGSK